ncbi:MAG: fused MFS/spermidine synthase, partial [Gemmataceae bacterium]
IILGDARLKLEERTDDRYQILLVDAFSSDAIPVHLLTKEAVQLYMNRITDDGLVALHISNKFVKLDLVAGKIAEELGLEARVFSDNQDGAIGKTASSWVVLARKPEHLGGILKSDTPEALGHSWKPLPTDAAAPAWTDDFSDVLSVMMIREIQMVRRALGFRVVKELAE